MKLVEIRIYLPKKAKEKLEAIAKKDMRTTSNMIEFLVERYEYLRR